MDQYIWEYFFFNVLSFINIRVIIRVVTLQGGGCSLARQETRPGLSTYALSLTPTVIIVQDNRHSERLGYFTRSTRKKNILNYIHCSILCSNKKISHSKMEHRSRICEMIKLYSQWRQSSLLSLWNTFNGLDWLSLVRYLGFYQQITHFNVVCINVRHELTRLNNIGDPMSLCAKFLNFRQKHEGQSS